MKRNDLTLRLQEARLGEADAEKPSALRTADYFRERAGKGDPKRVLTLLNRTGVGRQPDPGDEL